MRARQQALLVVALASVAPQCTERIEQRVLHRSNCTVCHQPLNSDGHPEGIEESHPWHPLTCTDCHGGNAWVCDGRLDLSGSEPQCDGEWLYDQVRAHPDPAGSPAYLRDLHVGELDEVDRDYLRFINPGDLRVVQDTCGRCHTSEAAAVRRSSHALAPGELAVARFRAGLQSAPTPRFGATAMVDPRPTTNPCAGLSVASFEPLPIAPASSDPLTAPSVANAQEQLLAKECIGCHVNDFGRNDAPGNYRSSGCSACHSRYAEDGLSVSADPWIDKRTPPHPLTHAMVTAAPTDACASCHHEGARIGISYRGLRDAAGPGLDPEDRVTLGRPLYGHAADHYVIDEDGGNAFDETPPDVHFEAGMDCVDCHTRVDVHGDGHIYADSSCVVRTRCADCHGDGAQPATTSPLRPNLIDRDGVLVLVTRHSGLELTVPQASAEFHDPAHMQALECSTCHAAWLPSCYGCHTEVDLSRSSPYLTSGASTPGATTVTPMSVALNDMVLMVNQRGRLSHSMPAGRMFMSLDKLDGSGSGTERIFERRPRRALVDGHAIAGFGQKPIDPHTTRRRSQFQACDRCHAVGEADTPDNAVLLDLSHGFGTERFVVRGCDVAVETVACDPNVDGRDYRLDAILTRDGLPLVVSGHLAPNEARPLTLDEIARMRAITLEPDDATTPIPLDAAENPRWPGPRLP